MVADDEDYGLPLPDTVDKPSNADRENDEAFTPFETIKESNPAKSSFTKLKVVEIVGKRKKPELTYEERKKKDSDKLARAIKDIIARGHSEEKTVKLLMKA